MRFWDLTKTGCFIDANRVASGQSDYCIFDNIDTGDTEEIELHRKILSYKIDGNFQVLLNTKQLFGRGSTEEARCQILMPNDEGCVTSVVSTNIYSSDPEGVKIESMMIIPLQ